MEEKHCPKCGTPLEMQDGDLICPKCFEEELKKAIEAKVRKQMQMERLEKEARERILLEEKEQSRQERIKATSLRIEGDYAYYGEYPQSEVNDPKLLSELKLVDDGSNPLPHKNRLYAKYGDRYFLYEPIKWMVLAQSDGAALLMSDASLGMIRLDPETAWQDIPQQNDWLEGTFMRMAFPDGGAYFLPLNGHPFFLPGRSLLKKEEYGFGSDRDRQAKATAYALKSEKCPKPDEWFSYATSYFEVVGENKHIEYVDSDGSIQECAYHTHDYGLRICACVELKPGSGKKDNVGPTLEELAPRKAGDKIIYGRYPQSEVSLEKKALVQKYGSKTEKGTYVYGNEEFSEWATYRHDPISWTIMFKNGDDYELVSEKILDSEIFDSQDRHFERSRLGKWLNETFLRETFPDEGASLLERKGFRVLLPIQRAAEESRNAYWAESVPTYYARCRDRALATSPRYWALVPWSPYAATVFPYDEHWRVKYPYGVRPTILIHLPPTEEELALEAKKKAEEEERLRKEAEAEEAKRLLEEQKRKEEEERQRLEEERFAANLAAKERAENEEKEKKLREFPTKDELIAILAKPVFEGGKITYGVYPRRLVTDILPKGEQTKHGPYVNIDNRLFYHDETGWYSVEPIRWIIVKKEGKSAMVISEEILDRRRFHEFYKGKKPFFGGFYSTDYAHSEIRKWLNEEGEGDTFPNLAFLNSADAAIEREVDNSEDSYYDPPSKKDRWCICENTVDRFFLISSAEAHAIRGSEDPELKKAPSSTPFSNRHPFDERYENMYWGRTPDYVFDGEMYAYGAKSIRTPKVDSTDPGVRPAMWIKIPE